MTKIWRPSAAVGILLAAAVAAGCSSSGGSGGDATAPADAQGRKVIVTMLENHEPTSWKVDGEWTGLYADISREVAKRNNWSVDYQTVTFDVEIPGLQSGKFDIGTSITAKEERYEVIDIVPVYESGYTFMTKDGKTIGDDMMDLCGLKIGTVAGGSPVATLEDQSKKCTDAGKDAIGISTFSDIAATTIALKSDRIEVMCHNPQTIAVIIKSNPSMMLTGPTFDRSLSGYGFGKGSDLAQPFVDAVNAMIEDGTYQDILAKYQLESTALEKTQINPNPDPAAAS